MKCEQCDSHLSAFVDDELTADLTSDVQQHLRSCQACRTALEDLRVVDGRLAELRLPSASIAHLQSAIRRDTNSGPPTPLPVTPHRTWPGRVLPWSIVAMIAASIALALLMMPQPEATNPIAGRLVRATGSVEVLVPGSDQWQRIEAEEEILMHSGIRVRTFPNVACEIETSEKALLRLDQTAELVLHAPNRVEIVKGQVWSCASDSKTLQVDTSAPDATTTKLLTMTCPTDSEFQWNVDQDHSACQSLSGGETQWTLTPFQCPSVSPGERVSVDTEHKVSRSREDSPATKIWQLPLLAVGQTVDEELKEIVESLLVRIGTTKAGYLKEEQIRRLGPPGAIPLLAYVQSDSSRKKIAVRRDAMRIAVDLADESAVERLRQLRGDEDPSIAQLADGALRRLE